MERVVEGGVVKDLIMENFVGMVRMTLDFFLSIWQPLIYIADIEHLLCVI